MFDQSFAYFSRVGILNSCNGFRLGWETTLLPLEEQMIDGLDEYDTLNDLEVGNYVQRHYIEKEGLRIDYLSKDEEEDTKEDISRMNLHKDPPRSDDAPASSSSIFDNLLAITFTHPAVSPRITLEGLTGLQTPESRVDPAD